MRIRATLFAALPGCLASLVLVLALAAAPAGAQLLPPGHSAADQYREGVPGVTGDRLNGGDDRSAEEVLGEENAEALREAGADGEAAAELAAQGAPEGKADKSQKQGVERAAGEQGDSTKLASIATGLGGSGGGLGPILPLLILTAIVAFTGIAVGRWRRSSSEG